MKLNPQDMGSSREKCSGPHLPNTPTTKEGRVLGVFKRKGARQRLEDQHPPACAHYFPIFPSLLLAFLMQGPSGVDMDSITVFESTDIPARAGKENTSCLNWSGGCVGLGTWSSLLKASSWPGLQAPGTLHFLFTFSELLECSAVQLWSRAASCVCAVKGQNEKRPQSNANPGCIYMLFCTFFEDLKRSYGDGFEYGIAQLCVIHVLYTNANALTRIRTAWGCLGGSGRRCVL